MFLAGAGVTVMQICCPHCFDNLIVSGACHPSQTEKADQHDCCANKTKSETLANCTDHKKHTPLHSKKGCCKIERISVDIDNIIFKFDFFKHWIADSKIHQCHFVSCANSPQVVSFSNIPPIPPREYLSLIRILII